MSWRQKLEEEIKTVTLAALYFACWISAMVILKQLVLAEYRIGFSGLSLALVDAAAAQHQAAAAAPGASAGKPLPVGTVVSALPSGCVSTPVGGVEYYYCGGNFYRAVFEGNNLVYVTAQPK
jgi:hypothetical protein